MTDATIGNASGEFSNEFGSVSSDRISIRAKKSWFGGGVEEELPIRHITSVRLETSRNVVGGIILVLLALAALYSGTGPGIMIGLILVALAALLLVGWPAVTVNTAGNDRHRMTGTIFQKQAAEAYVAAVKRSLFAKP